MKFSAGQSCFRFCASSWIARIRSRGVLRRVLGVDRDGSGNLPATNRSSKERSRCWSRRTWMACTHQHAGGRGRRGLARPSESRLSARRRSESRSVRKPRGHRRSLSELDELCDALCERVHARPGSSMIELAEPLGADVRALQRPMAKLKSAERVRSIGRRQGMRYFPAVPGASEDTQAATSTRRSVGA